MIGWELANVIELGQLDGSIASQTDARLLASILIGAIDGLLLQYFVEPKALPAPVELAETLAEMTARIVRA